MASANADQPGARSLGLRQILPVANTAATAPSSTSGRDSQSSTPVLPRPQHVKVACEACRKRKIRCSGSRPRCDSCVRRSIGCEYISADPEETNSQALKRKFEETCETKNVYVELYHILRSLPEREAHEVLRRLRDGGDITSVIRHAKAGDLRLQTALVPESRLVYEFPYVSEMPSALIRPGNPYLESLMYETTFRNNPRFPHAVLQTASQVSQYHAIYLTPYHAGEIMDPLLTGAIVSNWTSVSSDDDLLRRLLRAYFSGDYITFAPLQKDIFLRALKDGNTRFCSPLLVNAILAEACHCYPGIPRRAQFWDPNSLGYKFLAEAKRLWELEVGQSRLTTIQAAMSLHVTYSYNGMDKIGSSYILQAVRMARKINLFDIERRKGTFRNARVFTAWCLFSWQALQALHFFRAPMLRDPPATLLPDPNEDPLWFGEMWIKYPANAILFPMHLGHVFKGIAGLRHIANDIAYLMYEGTRVLRSLTDREVLHFQSRLDEWYGSLPDCMKPKNIVRPCQLKVHMEYSVLRFKISQMQSSSPPQSPVPASFGSALEDPLERTVSHALTCLETVIRLYYRRHSFEYCDAILTYYLSIVANVALEAMSDETARNDSVRLKSLRSTLILCLKGLDDQAKHLHVASILSLLLRERMNSDDVEIVKAHTSWTSVDQNARLAPPQARSDFPMTIVKLDGDSHVSTLENLVKKYEQAVVDASSPESSPEGSEGP